uniref:Uncharacterized protein n=3 Tax=Setaria TaxID=4554 RepID=K3YED3_SETIT
TEAVDFAALIPPSSSPSLVSSTVHTTRNSIQEARSGRAIGGEKRRRRRRGSMDRNLSGFLIGCAGAAVTLLAYQQTVVTSTQCIAAGFVVLLFGLFVKEGFISL